MKLNKLILDNFQGCQHFELNIDGSNAVVYGTNGAGKSTLRNAYMWLLLGESAVTTNFDPRPYSSGTTDEREHHLNSVVTGEFLMPDKSVMILAKSYHENWQTKRGKPDEEYCGNTTDHYIDGVKVKKSTYEDMLLQKIGVASLKELRMLCDPGFFGGKLEWQERAAILTALVGDITVGEVIASDPDLTDITDYLEKPNGELYTIDEYRRTAKPAMKKTNDRLKELPSRIDEATKALPTVHETREDLETRISTLNDEKTRLENERAVIMSSDAAARYRAKIDELQSQIKIKRIEHMQAYNEEVAVGKAAIYEEEERLQDIKTASNNLTAELFQGMENLSKMKALRNALLEQLKRVNTRQFNGDTVCPTCKRPLPESEIEEAKSSFNLNKSREIESIKQEAREKCSLDMISAAETNNDKLRERIEERRAEATALEEKISRMKASIKPMPPFEISQVYTQLSAEISDLTAKMNEAGNSYELKEIEAKINRIASDIANARTFLIAHDTIERQTARIEELKAEMDQLVKAYQDMNRGIYLCETFERQRASMLDERINSNFDNIRWQLYKTNKNGTIENCCEAYVFDGFCTWTAYNGVDTNRAAQINADIEIIDVLSKCIGVSVPVFVDGAESVININNRDLQTVCLTVSEQDDVLRVV